MGNLSDILQPARGAIYHEQAYAQGKMLNHSDWKLPRNITPSDVDLCFDNAGWILACELSRSCKCWAELKTGQRWLYEAFAKRGVLCALLRHCVPTTRQINTKTDIVSFSLMLAESDGTLLSTEPIDGHQWAAFVEDKWYGFPEYVWRRAKELAKPLYTAKPQNTNSNGHQS